MQDQIQDRGLLLDGIQFLEMSWTVILFIEHFIIIHWEFKLRNKYGFDKG